MLIQTVRQEVPNYRAKLATEACSRRSWDTAHQHALVVRSDLGLATRSVNTPTGQAGSGQDQVRLRQSSRTGLPNAGVSISWWTRGPWLIATTRHAGSPSVRRRLHRDPHPPLAGGHVHHVKALQADDQVTVIAARRGRTRRSVAARSRVRHRRGPHGAGWLVAPDPEDLDPHLTASAPLGVSPYPHHRYEEPHSGSLDLTCQPLSSRRAKHLTHFPSPNMAQSVIPGGDRRRLEWPAHLTKLSHEGPLVHVSLDGHARSRRHRDERLSNPDV